MPVVEEGLAVIQRQVVEARQKSGGSSEFELRWRIQSSDEGPIEVEVGGATVKVGLSKQRRGASLAIRHRHPSATTPGHRCLDRRPGGGRTPAAIGGGPERY